MPRWRKNNEIAHHVDARESVGATANFAGPTARVLCSVTRAIEIVERALQKFGAPVYVFHEIVHNQFVVNELKDKGAIFVNVLEDIPDASVAIFSAHGVSQAVRRSAQAKRLQVVDATCPLVTKVHNQAQRYAK